jgi:hypothetical protein
MKKFLLIAITSFTLTGCASLQEWIPSFWDDNQSAKIIDIRQRAHNIQCDTVELQHVHATGLVKDIQWFLLYSESKGAVQKDVIRLVEPMEKTVGDWAKRTATGEASKAYCEIKKKVIKVQADKAANSVLWRY